MKAPRQYRLSTLHYPVSGVYGAGVVVAIALANRVLDLGAALILLSTISLIVYVIGVRREVHRVHVEIEAQRAVLLLRIDRLVEYLIAAGVELPPGEGTEPADSRGEDPDEHTRRARGAR